MVTTKSATPSRVGNHLAKHGHMRVDLSPSLLSYWHGRLNSECFGRKLGRVMLTAGKTGDDMPFPVMGFYDADNYEPRLHVDSRCKTKQAVIDTLAHEMIHQLQHKLGLPLTHGKFFKAQAKRLLKHGITA